MHSLTNLNQRLNWTRGWLNTFTKSHNEKITDDFEIIPHLTADNDTTSDYGVESLSESSDFQTCGFGLKELLSDKSCSVDRDANSEDYGCAHCPFCNGEYSGWHEPAAFNARWEELERDGVPDRKDVVSYELAGRGVENTFRDLRSASKAQKRKRRQREKYFHYKAVKPGWLGKPFHDTHEISRDWVQRSLVLPANVPIVTVTKKMMFEEAQCYPRPPKYHRRRVEKEYFPWTRMVYDRKRARKHVNFYLDRDMYECCEEVEALKPDRDLWFNAGYPWATDSIAEWAEEHDRDMQSNWCDICYVHWGNCVAHGGCVVDQVLELRFESADGGQDWKLSWDMSANEAERANRAPAVIPYGKRDWVRHPYPQHYTEDDL